MFVHENIDYWQEWVGSEIFIFFVLFFPVDFASKKFWKCNHLCYGAGIHSSLLSLFLHFYGLLILASFLQDDFRKKIEYLTEFFLNLQIFFEFPCWESLAFC